MDCRPVCKLYITGG